MGPPAVNKKQKKQVDDGILGSDSQPSDPAEDEGEDEERSWSSATVDDVASEVGGLDPDSAVEVEPEPAEHPQRRGIKAWDVAPAKARANCCVCDTRVAGGDFRLDYRFRQDTSLRSQKRFHPACVHGIPDDTRVRDRRQVRAWLGDAALSADARAMLEGVLAALLSEG